MRFWADVRLEMQDDRDCLQLLDKGASGSDDIIGYLLTALYLIASAFIVSLIPVIGKILADTIAAAGIIVMLGAVQHREGDRPDPTPIAG